MMNNNEYSDLSGLSRDELLQLVVAQQSQLRTQQHHHQQPQQHPSFAGLTQRPSGLGAASLFQDRLLAPQSLGTASLGTGPNFPSFLAPRAVPSAPGMADLLRRRAALAAAAAAGPTTTAPQAELPVAATELELLQARRMAMASAASAPLSSSMRQLMLRQELLGTSSGGTLAPSALSATTSAPPPPSSHHLGSDLPSEGSTEDILLRRLIAGSGEPQAASSSSSLQVPSRTSLSLGGGPKATPSQESGTDNMVVLGMPSAVSRGGLAPVTTRTGDAHADALLESKPSAMAKGTAAAAAAAAGKKKTKRPLSAYNIFFKEEHAKIIAQNEREKAAKQARGESISSDDDYCDSDDENAAVDVTQTKGKKRKRSLSTNQPGKRGKRQVDFENLTKVIGRRWKELPAERVDEYKRRAEEAMQAYRKNLFQKIRNSVKEDQA